MHNAQETELKIYGERNSGTTYLHNLLTRNLNVRPLAGEAPDWVHNLARRSARIARQVGSPRGKRVDEVIKDWWFELTFPLNFGWKHIAVPSPDLLSKYSKSHSTLFIALVKNPYSWLLSLHRRPYHLFDAKDLPVHDFVSNPVACLGRENLSSAYLSPVELWNHKIASYIRLGNAFPTLVIRYEDLLRSPITIVRSISKSLNRNFDSSEFENIRLSSKPTRTNTYDDYREYYLTEQWRSDLDAATIEAINRGLDNSLMAELNYGKLEAR